MRIARSAAALLALGLAGCASYNPLVWLGIKNEPANKPTPLAPIDETAKPRAVWSASVGKPGEYRFQPAENGARIYAAAADGTISVIEAESGRIATRIDTRQRLSGGLAFAEGRIFAGTIKGEVIALDEAGKTAWTSFVGGEVIAPVAQSRKVVVARTSDGRIFGLSADDGKRRWVFQRATPTLLLRSESGALAIGGDVVAGYPNGKLIALDIEDGKLTWEVSVSLPRGATELERIADVAGLPVVDGANICAGAFQGKIACFEIASRNMLWSRDVSTALTLGRDAKNLYAIDDSSTVHALDKASGAVVWKQEKLRHRRLTQAVAIDRYVVVGDGFGYIHVLSPENGELIGRLALDGTAVRTLVPGAGGLLAQTAGGTLALIRF